MNKELKNVVTIFGKPFNVNHFIEHYRTKRRSFYICKQGGIRRDIKKGDKDVDMHFDISNITVKALEWLENEYEKEDIVIAFFIKGGYLPKDKALAEEFMFAVESLKESEGNDGLSKTGLCSACKQLKQSPTGIYLPPPAAAKEMDTLKFKISAASDYNKRSVPADNTTSSPSGKHITVTENDDIILDGLNVSLFSHLKTVAASSLSPEYVEILNNRFKFEEPPQHYINLFKDIIESVRMPNSLLSDEKLILSYFRVNNTVKFINSRINDAGGDDLSVLRIYREVLENHLQTPEMFDETRREYSEKDYILYFWGPLIKKSFIKTDVWSHWGDTESEECKYKFRMDLRFLCQSLKNSLDHGSGEFARNLTASKYYSDKKKLVLNGIIQLDNILSTRKIQKT